jgi:small-conductance mechanosensitive channel
VSTILARAVTGLLRAIRFDELARKSGLADFLTKMGTGTDSAGVVAGLVKWLVRIVVLLVAFDVLGLPAVSDVMRQLLLWLPNLVVAIFVLFIGGIAARALGNIVRGATAESGFSNPETLANVVRTTVWAFAIVVAINQLGIATNLINTLFTGFVGALAVALGLAFGLGGRDLASRTLENWYDQAQEAKPSRRKARVDEYALKAWQKKMALGLIRGPFLLKETCSMLKQLLRSEPRNGVMLDQFD